MASYRLGIDTGGTFTDVVAIDQATGRIVATKTPSTPDDPSRGLLAALHKVSAVGGFQLDAVSAITHGTTTATNAVLQGDFQRLGLLVTHGFRHVLEIARQSVPDGYGNSYFWVKPPRIVPLERVCEVRGRLSFDGKELAPLDEDDVAAAATAFEAAGVDCVAVCYLHSYANPEHERRSREILGRHLPEAFISISSDVLPEYREYERALTTLLDAFVKPYTRDYVLRAEGAIQQTVGRVPFLIMQSNGGLAAAHEVTAKPITTILSGPAAGVIGATRVAELAGFRNLMTLDAGGTSTDVSVVQDLEPHFTTESKVDRHPVKTPMLDIVTVAAGGGSIAWLGPRNALKVGPQSAGADPGPICYGRGGTRPTVTDANLLLGRIPPALLGGDLPLHVEPAREAFGRLGQALGLSAEEVAAGVLEIAAWNQTHGIRQLTVERGLDPRGYCLVAFGGSGPLIAGHIAELLAIETVLIPRNPGNTSAFGLQVSDLRHDFVRTFVRLEGQVRPAELDQAWRPLEVDGERALDGEGIEKDHIRLERHVDCRYLGEGHEVRVKAPAGPLDEAQLVELFSRFHDLHELAYGYSYRGHQLVELVNLRLQALGRIDRPGGTPAESSSRAKAAPAGVRRVYFDGGFVDCPIYRRDALATGARVAGPAIIEEFGSTTVVFPGSHVAVDALGNLLLRRSA